MSNTTKLPKRKAEKKVELVTFELEGFDGAFEVPSMKGLTLGVQRKLQAGDINPMIEALGDYAEVVDDMTDEEVGQFMEAWSEASEVDSGKSGPASA